MVITRIWALNVRFQASPGVSSILALTRRLQFSALLSWRRASPSLGGKERSAQPVYGERHLRRLLWYLLGGTRGGPNRVEVLRALRARPLNANQLAGAVHLDYKTIEHHVRVLEEHGLVVSSEKGAYGAVLFLTPAIEEAWPMVEEIWDKIGRTKISTADKRE
jgi:DNA-binding MarR family transcriptional regulator